MRSLKYPATGALSAEARAIFYQADGQPKPVGTIGAEIPRFAAFLERLARLGPDSFYVGPNAAGDRGGGQRVRRTIRRR